MAAAVYTFTKPTGVHGYSGAGFKVRFFDVTTDTGDHAAGGVTKTAASLGFKKINFVSVDGGVATQGTSGASAVGVGITYVSGGTSVKIQLYESAASGAPLGEKGAEAQVANLTCRLRIEGI